MTTDPSHISREPIQNLVQEQVGLRKAWKILGTDAQGNELIFDSLSWEMRWDYASRVDRNPVYVGYAVSGTATTDATWLIHKFSYTDVEETDMPSRREVKTGSWDGRVALFP